MLQIRGLTKQQSNTVIILSTTTFILVMNQTLLSPAFPMMMKDLQVTADTIQWLISAFMMASATTMLTVAFLLEKYTLRNLYIIPLFIYILGSILIGIGFNFNVVLIGRILQGAASGIIMSMTISCMLIIYPKEKRGSAMGFYGIITSIGPALAPAIAGIVISYLNWKIVFYGIAFFSFILMIVGWKQLPRTKIQESKNLKLDKTSLTLSCLGFGLALYSLSEIGLMNYSLLIFIMFFIGIIFIVLFIVRQHKISNPLLKFSLFKNIKFGRATICVIILNSCGMCNALLVPVLVQDLCGQSPALCGLMLTPGAVLSVVANPVIGRIFDKYGHRQLSIIGGFVLAVSTLALGLSCSNTSMVFLTVILTLRTISLLMYVRSISTWGINFLEKKEVAHGNTIITTFIQVAGSFFTAVFISSTYAFYYSADLPIFTGIANFIGKEFFVIDLLFVLQGVICIVCFVYTCFKLKN